jgi:hypothetical protein
MLRARTHWIVLTCSFLGALPVWFATYPPMVDLPQHAAQVAMFRNLHDPSFPFRDALAVNWFTPYLLGYALIYVLTPLFGILISAKIVVSLAIIAAPLFTALVLRELGGDPLWAVLTIPGMYGFAFAWGMLNYLVAAPLGIAFFWLCIRHVRKPASATFVCLTLAAVGLFFSHALVWGFFVGVCVLYILFEAPSLKRGLLLALPALITIPLIGLWMFRFRSDVPQMYTRTLWDLGWIDAGETFYRQIGFSQFGPHWGRAAGFMARLLGFQPGLVSTAAGLLLFALPLIAGCRPNRRFAVWIPFASCMLVLFFAPTILAVTAGSTASFVYQRFAIFALPLFVCAISAPPWAGAADGKLNRPPKSGQTSPSRRYRALRLLAPLVVLLWIVVLCFRAASYNREARGFDAMLAQMYPRERALSMVFEPYTDVSIAPPFLHFPQWYAAEKEGLVDPSFATTSNVLVFYRDPNAAAVQLGFFEFQPGSFTWAVDDGANYRYFILRADEDYGPSLFRDATCQVTLRFHQEKWWLYERATPCAQEHGGMTLKNVPLGSFLGLAGFEVGDVIIEFGGNKVDTPSDFYHDLRAHRVGDSFMVTAMRGQQKITRQVTLVAH